MILYTNVHLPCALELGVLPVAGAGGMTGCKVEAGGEELSMI